MSNSLNERKIRELIEKEINKRINELTSKNPLTREEFLKGMDIISERFEAMDRRFEELIKTMNDRFEAMDQRFEAVDRRFEELIKTMNDRFEVMDRRFEAVDRRFEEADRRFKELITTMNDRFEASDQRFKELVEAMNRNFLILKVAIDSLGRRSGIQLEKTILKLLEKSLRHQDIDINKVQWIELIDEKGEVFPPNYRTDVDVLIRDGLHFLMEIKYKADNRDVFHFLKVAELYAKKYRHPNKLILVSLEINPKTQEYAEKQNIEVITGEET
ncbi:MAG: DUF3782 domain-containing protein [Candidatus Helarchaeota archaeon]